MKTSSHVPASQVRGRPRPYLILLCLTAVLEIRSPARGLEQWHNRNSATLQTLNDVIFAQGIFVAVGQEGVVVTSSDGICWTESRSETSNSLSAIAWGNGLFVAVGSSDTILTSLDGHNWALGSTGASPNGDGMLPAHYDVAYGGGRFVTVGSEIVATSVDGIHWESGRSQWILDSVTSGNGAFVAAAGRFNNAPAFLVSANGLAWTYANWTPAFQPNNHISALTFGRGYFLVGSGRFCGGFCFPAAFTGISEDGIHWKDVDGPLPELRIASYGNGMFIAVGEMCALGGPCSYLLLSSRNGLNWTDHNLAFPIESIRAICAGNHTFVAVGNWGRITQSDPIVDLTLRWDGWPELSISGPSGTYRIDSTDDLTEPVRWETVATVTIDTDPFSWVDPQTDAQRIRFYRAVLVP